MILIMNSSVQRRLYARCYLSSLVGEVETENFWHEIWIDSKLISRTRFEEPPDSIMGSDIDLDIRR